MKKSIIVSTLILSSSLTFAFDLGSIAKSVVDNVTKEQTSTQATTSEKATTNTTNTSTSNISDSTVTSGLKEALKTGVNYAVTQLGSSNGYLDNSAVKIPLPDNLAKAETLLRSLGGNQMADNLIN